MAIDISMVPLGKAIRHKTFSIHVEVHYWEMIGNEVIGQGWHSTLESIPVETGLYAPETLKLDKTLAEGLKIAYKAGKSKIMNQNEMRN